MGAGGVLRLGGARRGWIAEVHDVHLPGAHIEVKVVRVPWVAGPKHAAKQSASHHFPTKLTQEARVHGVSSTGVPVFEYTDAKATPQVPR